MTELEKHRRYLTEALKVSLEDAREVPVGAVVVRKGEIIARAHNEREADAHDPFGHAEMLAMRQAAKKLGTRHLRDCTLYVTLEPCPMCAGAMLLAELVGCFFSAFDPVMGCCGSVYDLSQDPAFPRHVPTAGGLLAAEAEAQLRAFFDAKRKAPAENKTPEQENGTDGFTR